MNQKINSFTVDAEKKSFVNRFSNMELFYKKQDEKRSSIFTDGAFLKSTMIPETKDKSLLKPRTSRKSIIFPSPQRKSFMMDSKLDLYAISSEKNRNILKTIDLKKYTADQLLDVTVSVLQKPSNYRSQTDIKLLAKATENIKFFQEISQENGVEIHEQICKYMTHKYLSADETVFNEGTIGSTFYVILKGSVSVCKFEKSIEIIAAPLTQSPTEKLRFSFKKGEILLLNHLQLGIKRSESVICNIEKKSNEPPSPFKKSNDAFSPLKKINDVFSPMKKSISSFEKLFERNVLTEIRLLEIGNSFGELALIENKPRAATIKCKENCHFAVLDKLFFLHILKENEQKKLFQHIDFFSNLLLFKHWTYNEVKNLKLHCEILELKRNKFVYKEGDPSEFFYIVRSGEFKLVKELTILSDKDLFDKKLKKIHIPKFLPQVTKKSQQEFDIAILMPGEFFGEEELIEAAERKLTVICIHPGSLYSINKKEFFRRVMNDNYSKAHLLSEIKEKRKWRGKRLREFVLLQRNTNTFLKELASHETLLKDFDINEMDLLLKTENLGEEDPFSEEIDHSIEKNKAKIALKAKISNVLNNSPMHHEEIFFFDAKKNGKKMSDNHLLYDYFIENKRKIIIQKRQNKNAKKTQPTSKKENFIEKIAKKKEEIEEFQFEKEASHEEFKPNSSHFALPCLEKTPLRKIKERMHLFINIPEVLTAQNLKNSVTSRKADIKSGFFSERRGFYNNKSKIQDFELEIGNTKKSIESFKVPLDKIREILPLKYKSREIYEKIRQKNKKVRGLREKTGLSQSLSLKDVP